MATLLSTIISRARITLLETTASFWTDAELLDHARTGITDLWGAIVDLHQEHYFTVDPTNVSQAANATTLTGVPSDCFRVIAIEPRTLTVSASGCNIIYTPKDYKHPLFAAARAQSASDLTTSPEIFYALSGAGAPVAAPTIYVAPMLSAALLLRLVYIPTIDVGALTSASNNPIPGEADKALEYWIAAQARAKERDDRSPDPNHLASYGIEKNSLRTRLTPRQEQEPEVVEDFFSGYWGN